MFIFIREDALFVSSKCLVKRIHRDSYSFLSIKLSCTDFLFTLSKDLCVSWFFSYCFSFSVYFYMIIQCNTLLANDRVHAIPADIGKTIKPIPVIDRVIKVDVAPIITIVSIDSNIVFKVL